MSGDPATASEDLLRLVQWLSPAFPLGSFAYSHGLEWAISAGDVTDPTSLSGWLSDLLRHGTGRNDAILCVHALRSTDSALPGLGELAMATATCRERAQETLAQGQAFCRTLAAIGGPALPTTLPLPVALGAAARGMALPPDTIVTQMLHAFTSNLVTVAVRFVPLGQTDGQRVLSGLHPTVLDVAAEATHFTLDDLGGAFLRGDLAAIHHETMETRIFQT
ncbi:urease accessory protein UreF [Roseicitreum antarcticum]|uniref:urease accessory protein UreF n=1 Tax=Roseicitreum antarcticum TaxID=564137 RepID=UPI0037CCB0CA